MKVLSKSKKQTQRKPVTESVQENNKPTVRYKYIKESAVATEFETALTNLYWTVYDSVLDTKINLADGSFKTTTRVKVDPVIYDQAYDLDLLDQDFDVVGVGGEIRVNIGTDDVINITDNISGKTVVNVSIQPNGRALVSGSIDLSKYSLTFNDVITGA